jgi:hypothetical protein
VKETAAPPKKRTTVLGSNNGHGIFCCGVWTSRGHGLVAVHGNEIYHFPDVKALEHYRRLTPEHWSFGSKRNNSSVLNGDLDYLYRGSFLSLEAHETVYILVFHSSSNEPLCGSVQTSNVILSKLHLLI